MSKNEFLYKILIIGDYSVWKTSFLNRYVSNAFTVKTLSTLGVDYVLKNATRKDGSTVKLKYRILQDKIVLEQLQNHILKELML